MKTIKFLQESFEETKERFQQEISFKYSYNRNTVESVDFRINRHNIKYFYEAMQNFENSLVDEFKEKKNNFCNAKQFLESINDFDKIIFVIINYMKTYFNFCKDYSKISLHVHLVQFDFTTSVLIQGFYNDSHMDLNFSTKLESQVLYSENELLQEKLDLIREEICELIGVDPNLKKQGHEDNYVFNLDIESDNQIGFFLQATKL
ncbi:MAG: hypothetical protein [Bacteriophage sp.]|nr:MAG: hypothetical protein [Bacteriophage sp.]